MTVDRIKKAVVRRKYHVRKKVFGTPDRPRLSVFRSNRHMYAQIIDDNAHTTLVSCSSLELKDVKGDKKAVANAVGKELAKRAKEKGIKLIIENTKKACDEYNNLKKQGKKVNAIIHATC